MSFQQLLLNVGDWILGTSFLKTAKEWRILETYSKEQIDSLSNTNLKNILNHACQNISYYKSIRLLNGNNPTEDLKQFPILNKHIIRDNIDNLIVSNETNLVYEDSSGSSGVQGRVYMSREEQYRSLAHQTYLWELSGYRLGAPILQLGITPNRSLIKTIKDKVLNTNYQEAFNLDKKKVAEVLLKTKDSQSFFGGYASGIYTYALIAEELGLNIKFESVISWGDKLFPHYRSKIEDVFNTKVFDTYGCTEGFMIAGQCEYGSYHILSPHVYVEILNDENEEVETGEMGRVVVTRLDAYKMPLIRYELGDLAFKAEKLTCGCQRPFPLLGQIVGRDTDIVITPRGKSLIVHFFTGIFEHVPSIRQFKIIQHENGKIQIDYIPDQVEFQHEILEKINNEINQKAGERIEIEFKKVNKIKATASGKPQIIESKIKKQNGY